MNLLTPIRTAIPYSNSDRKHAKVISRTEHRRRAAIPAQGIALGFGCQSRVARAEGPAHRLHFPFMRLPWRKGRRCIRVVPLCRFHGNIARYGTVQLRCCASRPIQSSDPGMPDQNLPQNLPQPPDFPTTPSAQQADAPRESGSGSGVPPTNFPPNRMPPQSQNSREASERLPYWLRQSERFVRVVVRMYIGLGVCCVPWIPSVWDANPLFASSPHLQAFMTQGAVRGLVSGLGLLNLWVALRDALSNPADPSQQ